MARARGANAIVALAYAASYGAISAANNYLKLPFVSIELGDEQGLVESDLLGYGRDPQAPGRDVVNNDGSATVPVDLRAFGYWLKLFFGAATVTTGQAATGSYAFSAQPANNAILTVNGTAVTLVTGTPVGNQVKIGADLAETVRNLVVFLNSSADANIAAASYSADLALATVLITHDTIGTAGNAFTVVAGTSPATNATASGATLAGGSASGAKNHEFVAGALTLPDAAIEIGQPDVPTYAMNYGVVANTLSIPLQRSGQLNAQLGLIAQGENPRTASTAVGTLTEIALERFSQFTGQIYRDGVPLGDIVGGSANFSNGMDKVEAIRSDGRISGVEPGLMAATLSFTTRFKDTVLLDLASAGTPVEIVFSWRIATGKTLTFKYHNVYLPKPRFPISGPGGIQAEFAGQASEHPTLHRTLTVTLVNDVTAY